MNRKTLALLPLLALTACATPREQCISSALRPLAPLDNLIATAQGNIERGFGVTEVQDFRTVRATCIGKNEDGTTFRFSCDEPQTITRTRPVAINIAEEQIKLEQLQTRRDIAQRQADAQIQQCRARYLE